MYSIRSIGTVGWSVGRKRESELSFYFRCPIFWLETMWYNKRARSCLFVIASFKHRESQMTNRDALNGQATSSKIWMQIIKALCLPQGFEVNWPRNFKKNYLCCYSQFHTKLYLIGKGQRYPNREKKYVGLNKVVDTKRVFLGYKRV